MMNELTLRLCICFFFSINELAEDFLFMATRFGGGWATVLEMG